MSSTENPHKLPGEVKRKRRTLSRPWVYWPLALFFLWFMVLLMGLITLLKGMGHFSGIKDPVMITGFLIYAFCGPLCAFFVLRTQRMTKFLWALINAAGCPLLTLLWLFAIARQA